MYTKWTQGTSQAPLLISRDLCGSKLTRGGQHAPQNDRRTNINSSTPTDHLRPGPALATSLTIDQKRTLRTLM